MKPPAKDKHHLLARGARSVLSRLRRSRQDPALRSIDQWNSEYQSGKWSYLAGVSELARYSVLTGYAAHFKPGGSILDVGCGEGVFYRRIRPHGYSRYVGVDLASSAIRTLQQSGEGNSAFVDADAESYVPAGYFDTLVFNEVLYYFRDPLAAVERYAQVLSSDGIMLVSTCTQSQPGMAILAQLRRQYSVLDETRVTHGDAHWSWIVSAFARNSGAA
jgi:2-polyprenyl-3-methyl-5-hydroxy-6-metoxy-1,4-benzoquinol methylase